MSNAKHTPGPWKVSEFSKDHYVMSGSGYVIAHIKAIGAYKKSHAANASLIADAPKTAAERDRLKEINAELLAALERILYAHDNHGNGAAMGEAVLCHHYAETARAAIAKAKGE